MRIDHTMLIRSLVWLTVIAGGLVLIQLWFSVFSAAFFWKALASLAVIGGVASLVIAIRQDLQEEKKMKDDGFVN